MTERSEEEIELGYLAGVSDITLGGKRYPAREPTNARARVIRKALVDYEAAAKAAGSDGARQVELLESAIDTCLQNFSEAISADWARIAETATDRERMTALVVIRDSVMAPFMTVAKAAAPPKPNRKARRAKS